MGAGELHLADKSGHNAARCRCFCRYVHWMGGIDGCDGCGNCSATLSSTGWRFGCARGVCWHFGDRDSVKVAHERDRHGAAVVPRSYTINGSIWMQQFVILNDRLHALRVSARSLPGSFGVLLE